MLINLSNHPSSTWSPEQTDAAKTLFGETVDMPFPDVDPLSNEDEVNHLASHYVEKINGLAKDQTITVHVMGEMTLTFALVYRLMREGIPCVASTTQRITRELPDRKKEVVFQFVRFRKYLKC